MYTVVEKTALYELLLDQTPIGPVAWDAVARDHNISFPDKDRDVKSLKLVFSRDLKKSSKQPTGVGEIPYLLQLVRQVEDKTLRVSGARVFGDDVINERAHEMGVEGVEESSNTEEEDEVECVPETEPQFVHVPGTDMNDGPEDQYNFEDLQQPTQTQATQRTQAEEEEVEEVEEEEEVVRNSDKGTRSSGGAARNRGDTRVNRSTRSPTSRSPPQEEEVQEGEEVPRTSGEGTPAQNRGDVTQNSGETFASRSPVTASRSPARSLPSPRRIPSMVSSTQTRRKRKTSLEGASEQILIDRASREDDRRERELTLREREFRLEERDQERRADEARRRERAEEREVARMQREDARESARMQREEARQRRMDEQHTNMMMIMMSMVSGKKPKHKKHNSDGDDTE
jgi:hypothetical protein